MDRSHSASRRPPLSLQAGTLTPAWDRRLERWAFRRRPSSVPSPEQLGTMVAVGGRPGEDARLDAGLVAAALDRPYRARVVERVRDLRTRPYTWARRAVDVAWCVGFVAGLAFVLVLVRQAGL